MAEMLIFFVGVPAVVFSAAGTFAFCVARKRRKLGQTQTTAADYWGEEASSSVVGGDGGGGTESVFKYQSKKWWAGTLLVTFLPMLGAIIWLVFSSGNAGNESTGTTGCRCLSEFPRVLHGVTTYNTRVNIAGVDYHYPLMYGLNHCDAYDIDEEPYCADAATRPAWCTAEWCYVDAAACDLAFEPSVYFSAANLTFSYAACGGVPPGWSDAGTGTQAGGRR